MACRDVQLFSEFKLHNVEKSLFDFIRLNSFHIGFFEYNLKMRVKSYQVTIVIMSAFARQNIKFMCKYRRYAKLWCIFIAKFMWKSSDLVTGFVLFFPFNVLICLNNESMS